MPGLDQIQKKRLGENLDYDTNGRLSAFANKAAALDEPILIIGLGGTGVDAVLNVKRRIYDRLACAQVNGEWQDKPANIEYLCLDTDRVSETLTLNGLGFNAARNENLIFTKTRLGTILENKESYLPMDVRSWVNDNLHCDMVINGAGANRQVGRLMMFMNIEAVVSTIEAKIRKVSMDFPKDTPIKVFVMSGISGGTGSGTFIDISYIVKGITNKPEIGRTAEIVGMLFLPDVNISRPSVNETKKLSLRQNGFAALKELDYLMNLHNTKEFFDQTYGSLHVREQTGPFYACVLMSAKSGTGVVARNAYEYTLGVAAETVVNFIAREDGTDPQNFSINSFLSNQFTDRAIFTNRLRKNRKPVNYLYCLAGASSAHLPTDDFVSYLTYLAFQKIDEVWNATPRESDVQTVLDRFSLSVEGMEMRMNSGIPTRPNMDRHTFERIEQHPEMVIADYEETLRMQTEYLDERIRVVAEETWAMLQHEDSILNEAFRSVRMGPMFCRKLISETTEGAPSVLNALKQTRNTVLAEKPDDQRISYNSTLMNESLDKIRSKKLWQMKGRLRDEFLDNADLYYDERLRRHAADCIAKACDRVIALFREKNAEVYECCAELQETLVTLFRKYGRIPVQESGASAGGAKLEWNIVEPPDFIQAMLRRMEPNQELHVDLVSVIGRLYERMLSNVDIWRGRVKADIVEVLNSFLWEEFRAVLGKSMDYYLDLFAQAQGKRVEDYCTELVQTLNDRATILFSGSAASEGLGLDFPGHSFLSVPMNAARTRDIVTSLASGGMKAQVFGSAFVDRLFMMNFKTSVPLYFYDELFECEMSYEANIAIPGVHLYERNAVSSRDWHDLPSPCPETEWLAGRRIERIAAENREYRDLFDKAREYGYIAWEAGNYVCRWGGKVDPDAVLAANEISLKGLYHSPVQLRNAHAQLSERIADRTRLAKSRLLYDNLMLDDGVTPNDNYAKNIFLKMVEAKQEIAAMVRNHQECLEVLEQIGTGAEIETNLRNYLRCRFTDIVFGARGGIWKYRDRGGVAHPLHVLEGTEANNPEYFLFTAFAHLEKAERDRLDKLSKDTFAALTETDGPYAEMKRRTEEETALMEKTLERLKENWQTVSSGAMMLDIYRSIVDEAKAFCLKL